MIRNATPEDFGQILEINLEQEHYLSPMDHAMLVRLHGMADYHRVCVVEGRVAAFLMAFREGVAYESLNYRWFSERHSRFLYIDRIAVRDGYQGQGLGRLLYEDLFRWARETGAKRLTCEYYVEPLNESSSLFHQRFGFQEVGTQWVAGGTKKVSLQEALP